MESSLKQRIYENILGIIENWRYIKSTAEATFVVSLINGCEIHPRKPDSCQELARPDAAVGYNLSQLARIANFNGKAEDAYLQEEQQIMTRIWLLMKEQL